MYRCLVAKLEPLQCWNLMSIVDMGNEAAILHNLSYPWYAILMVPHKCHCLFQVTFKSGLTAVLDRQNFEWNQSKFNQYFRESKSACDFVTTLREVTQFDSERGYIVPKPDSAMVISSPVSPGDIDEEELETEEEDMNLPAQKRPNIEDETSSAGPPSKSGKTVHHIHANPLDDAILSKKIGM